MATDSEYSAMLADKELFEKRWNDTVAERDAAILQNSELKAKLSVALQFDGEEIQRLNRLNSNLQLQICEMMPIVRSFGHSHPRWDHPTLGTQDPVGVHAVLEKYDVAEKRKDEGCDGDCDQDHKRNHEICSCLHDKGQHVKTKDGKRNECLASDGLGRSICKCMVFMEQV